MSSWCCASLNAGILPYYFHIQGDNYEGSAGLELFVALS
jgi:hypothetical protein